MKYHIIRMNNGKQQHYDRAASAFATSFDRWDGEFEATREEAAATLKKALQGCRKTRTCGLPALYLIQ